MKGQRKMKRIVAYLLVITTLVGAMIVPSVASTTTESGENEEPVIECPNGEHDIIAVEAKPATYTGVGWDAYEECSRCSLYHGTHR